MVISMVQAIVMSQSPNNQEAHDHALVICELLDTAIVLILALRIGFVHRIPYCSDRRLGVWILSLPVLSVLLVLNFVYHAWVRDYLKLDWLQMPDEEGLTRFTLLTHCLQPAIVEEVFFRYIVFGVLRQHCGIHATILVSSAMFTICHVHALLSMPYLFFVGVVLGYARYFSRTLILPIGMHFVHNLIVTIWEAEA